MQMEVFSDPPTPEGGRVRLRAKAHSSSTGTQSIFYRCTSFAHSETASRTAWLGPLMSRSPRLTESWVPSSQEPS